MSDGVDVGAMIRRFGVDPTRIGIRYSLHWIVTEIGVEERQAGAQVGDLCVLARDGAGGEIDGDALYYRNLRGMAIEVETPTYARYYYAPLDTADRAPSPEISDAWRTILLAALARADWVEEYEVGWEEEAEEIREAVRRIADEYGLEDGDDPTCVGCSGSTHESWCDDQECPGCCIDCTRDGGERLLGRYRYADAEA